MGPVTYGIYSVMFAHKPWASLFFSSRARFCVASSSSICEFTSFALDSPVAARAAMPPPPLPLEPACEGGRTGGGAASHDADYSGEGAMEVSKLACADYAEAHNK